MGDVEPTQSPAGPTEVKPPSRTVRTLTSWKLWAVLLVLAVIGIALSITLPIMNRLRAMRYFDHDPHDNAGYVLSDVHDDWPEKYGEWVNALRDMDDVWDFAATDESLRHVYVLNDMKELILEESKSHPFTDRLRGDSPTFPQLEHIQFGGQGFSDEHLAEFLDGAPNLMLVVFGKTNAGRETMAVIARIPSVTLLDMTTSPLDDEVFLELPSMPHLEECRVAVAGDQCAAWLASCPVIARVSFQDSSLTDAGLQRLTAAKSIVSIHLHGVNVTDAGLQHLASFPLLESLGVHASPGLTATGISRLPDLPHLLVLDIPSELLTADSIARLRQLPKLHDLWVSGIIADPAIRQLAETEWVLHEYQRP